MRMKTRSAPLSVDLSGVRPLRLSRRLPGFHPEPPNLTADP